MEQLGEVFNMLSIPFNNSLNVRAKGEYRTNRRHYRDVLTEGQIKIIQEIYKKEIFMHGYEF